MAAERTVALISRDLARLSRVHPHLKNTVLKVLAAMDELGWPMTVVSAVRSDAQQAELYAQGRTKPGQIVTNTDGVTIKSMHQIQATGFGHAVDCAFIDDPLTLKIEIFDETQPWDLYGLACEKRGLTWGGRWTTIKDRPHVELALGSPFATL